MHRRVLLVVIALAALGLVAGTGGFSAASMDRGVSVTVVDHDEAYVALYDPGSGGTAGRPVWLQGSTESPHESPVTSDDERTRLFIVANQFADHTIQVDGSVPGDSAPAVSAIDPVTLAPDEVGSVTAVVECPSVQQEVYYTLDLTVTVDGEGDSVSAEIEYPVTVVCAADQPPTPEPTDTDGSTPESE